MHLSSVCYAYPRLINYHAFTFAMLFLFRLLSTNERSLAESLVLLVAPVMDLLAGARTRLYLSHINVVSSLELLTSLLGQWLLQGVEQEVVGEREVKPHKVEVMPGMYVCTHECSV